MNGLPDALLFALKTKDGGVLKLDPVLLVSLQSESLRSETYKNISMNSFLLGVNLKSVRNRSLNLT